MALVYTTFGSLGFHIQARLSILSALRNGARPEAIAVFTDDPSHYSDLGVDLHPISPSDLRAFRGPMNFHHRVKIVAILRFAEADPSPIIYADSETYWLRDPRELEGRMADGTYVMERLEGVVSETCYPRLHRFLGTQKRRLEEAGFGFAALPRSMYTAGVIGLPAQARRVELLREVLALTDDLTLHFPRQMEWLEQYAFSSVLAERAGLGTAEGFVNHYWDINAEAQILLPKLPDRGLRDLADSPEKFSEFAAKARALQNDPAHRRYLRRRRLRRSYARRLAVCRAFLLRHFK